METKKDMQLCFEIGESLASDLLKGIIEQTQSKQFKELSQRLGPEALRMIAQGASHFLHQQRDSDLEEFKNGLFLGFMETFKGPRRPH